MNNIRNCVIGLGYVGLPLARLFSTKYPTAGYDKNKQRVKALNNGHDLTTLQGASDTIGMVIGKGDKGVVYDVKGIIDRKLIDGRL